MHLDSSFNRQLIQGLVHAIRIPLTRSIGVRYADVRDEIITAFNDKIPMNNEGKKIDFCRVFRTKGP